jgi:hypothetical protein
MGTVGSEYDDYMNLLQRFIQSALPADEFQLQYLNMFKQESRHVSDPLFDLLDRLFGDVDAFCRDPFARRERCAAHPGFYLDESGLRLRVVQAAEALRALQRNAPTTRGSSGSTGGAD